MQNEKKEYVDSYIPRKCFATNKILNAKDKASIQVNFSTVSQSYNNLIIKSISNHFIYNRKNSKKKLTRI